MKLAWFGGLLTTPIVIGFGFGKSVLKVISSISLEFGGLVLKHKRNATTNIYFCHNGEYHTLEG